MIRQVYRQYAWLLVAFIVAVVAIGTVLSYIDFGRARFFNAAILTLAWLAWMSDYMESRHMLYRRQRRLRLAFAGVLASGTYGSLDAALSPNHDPRIRVALVSLTAGALLVSIMFHPDDDLEIPGEVEFPWERWLHDRLHR